MESENKMHEIVDSSVDLGSTSKDMISSQPFLDIDLDRDYFDN